jgi:hypothetical protein
VVEVCCPRDLSTQVVIAPAEYKSGEMIYPYEKAWQARRDRPPGEVARGQ